MHRLFLSAFVIAAVVSTLSPARGEIMCVAVDGTRDNLDPKDRAAAKTLVEETLRANGQTVVSAPCENTITLVHIKFGKRINVTMTTSDTSRKESASSLEDVPDVYDQMVKSLLTGMAMGTGGPTMTRNTVTARQEMPRRAQADWLGYLRLGAGSVVGGNFIIGPSLGAGFRYELDWLGIDASANLLVIHEDDDTEVAGSWIKLMGIYFFNPVSDWATYAGFGMSWGGAALIDDDLTYSRTGLQGELALGFEMLRSSTIRMFLQFDATLPVFMTDADVDGADDKYTPVFSLSFGIGWARGRNQQTVRIVN